MSTCAYAKEDSKSESASIKEVALSYQKGFDLHKKDLIKDVTTSKHYKELNANKLLDRLFKVNKIKKDHKYDVKVTQSKVVKDMILAKIIDHEDHENSKTLQIKKTEQGYKVDSFVHMDE